MKVIIAGNRNFNNYELLKERYDYYLQNIKEEIIIISGHARGADSLGEKYAKERNYSVELYPAEWDKYGKSAGYVRNSEMAKVGDALIAFLLKDQENKGTKMMIELGRKKNIPIRIVES